MPPCKLATSSRRSPRIVNQETEGTKKKTPDYEPNLRPRVKRLTVKQLRERKLLILETVRRANEEHAALKQMYLNQQEEGSQKLPKKITFQNNLRLSNGEEKAVNFEDGNSAKRLMNLNGQSKAQVKKETSQKKRKAEDKVETSDDIQLKKVKMDEQEINVGVSVVISIPKTNVFKKKT